MTATAAGRASDEEYEDIARLIAAVLTRHGHALVRELTPEVERLIAAERARAVADLRAAVTDLVDELEDDWTDGDWTPDFADGFREGQATVARRLRAVLDATSEEQHDAVKRVEALADFLDRCADDTRYPNPIVAAHVTPEHLAILGRAYRDDARRIRDALRGESR